MLPKKVLFSRRGRAEEVFAFARDRPEPENTGTGTRPQ